MNNNEIQSQNNAVQVNESFFYWLTSNYSNIKGLSLENNILEFMGKKINISGIDLRNFIITNDSVRASLVDLSGEDLFNIINLNVIYNMSIKNEMLSNKDDIKNVELKFEKLFNSLIDYNGKLNEVQANQVNQLNSYYFDLMKYKSYLSNDLLAILSRFEEKMENLDIVKQDKPLTENQGFELDKYHQMSEEVLDLQNTESRETVVKRELKKSEIIAGYFNIFSLVLLLISIGLSAGFILLSKVLK